MESLEELHEYLFFQDRKCFKELMEHSESIIELLNAESIGRKCSKLIDRDDILYSLSLIWDLFHLLVSKRTKNLCPSLCNFCQLLCKRRCIFQMLVTCLANEDHFIAFQAHKIFREIARVFPEIILNGPLQELILSCLNEKKGTLVFLYTIEIIKDLLNDEAGPGFDSKQERLQGFPSNCDCTLMNEANLCTVNVDVEDVWNILLQYWPALSQLCLDVSFLISDANETISQKSQSEKAILQQTIASFVSLGSILVQLHVCHHPTVNRSSQPKYSKVKFSDNVNASQFYSEKENCIETQIDIGKEIKLGGDESVLSIFKSLQEAVEKLVEIDKQEFSLHLRRTLVQFFNDVVSISFQNSLAFLQRNFRHDALDCLVSICSFLLVNVCKLFRDIPQVRPGVSFGGQDFKNKEQLGSLVYDRVMIRKVVLLVLKSVLITLQAQKKSKSSNWKLLTDSLECWLKFVAKAMPEFHEGSSQVDDTSNMVAHSIIFLFADQDDELMTVLQYILKLYQELFVEEGSLPATQWSEQLRRYLNPNLFFLKFLHSIHYDHSLLLDFLISNETCFLSYFLSYLRHMANDWDDFVGVAKELYSSRAKNVQKTESGHKKATKKNRNSKFTNLSTCQNARLSEKHFTNKALFSENRSVALQDLREKYLDDITFLDSEQGMEWSSGNDFNHVGNIKERKTVEVSVSKYSALLSIMDDYGDLSSDDIQDDESDWNETDNKDDNEHEIENRQENCGDNEDHDEDQDEDHDQNCNNHDEGHDQHCIMHNDEDHDRHFNRHNHDQARDDDVDDDKMDYLCNSLSCLIRLRFLIERVASKQLFPYPAQALVRLIRYIESLYEGN